MLPTGGMGPAHDEQGRPYFRVGIVGAHYPTYDQGWDVVRFVVSLPRHTHVYVYGHHGADRDASLAAKDLGMSVWRLLPKSPFDSSEETLYQFLDLDQMHCWLAPAGARDKVCDVVRRMIVEGVPWVQH